MTKQGETKVGRRLSRETESSLELLLDTMCNSFGGVIFIAILVSLMSQTAKMRRPPDADALKARQAETTRTELRAELESMEAAGQQQSHFAAYLATHPNAALLPEWTSLVKESEQTERQIAETESALTQQREKLRAAEGDAATANRNAGDAAASVAKARQERENRATKRELRLPRLRSTTKSPLWMLVKNSRLYITRFPEYSSAESNEADLVIARNSNSVRYTARPGKGALVENEEWATDSRVRRILNRCATDSWDIQFAVYRDSYPAFIKVKEYFVRLGYDCNWAPMSDDDDDLVLVAGNAPIQ